MPSPVFRFLSPFCTILPRRARPLFPADEYVIAAPIHFIVSVEVDAPGAILPAVLVLHITAPFPSQVNPLLSRVFYPRNFLLLKIFLVNFRSNKIQIEIIRRPSGAAAAKMGIQDLEPRLRVVGVYPSV